ncbi:Palmitoyl-protein thioesterase 1 [Ceratocystis lukuohia]|uniref:Palmitoyl-protein thioesterase 1 n=1 Tax=Ceratocystis lukuohia TaxID=2019550 RepID=A0ABR4MFR2_9PEZI
MRSQFIISSAIYALWTSSVASATRVRALVDKSDDDTPLPVVIWHGLGDAYNAEGLQSVGELIDSVNPGTFVYFVQLGADGNEDRSATFLGNVSAQIEHVCEALASHPIISTAPAIDALGFSQGGTFLRGYIERCNSPPIRSLVTFGSPHNGITRFRDCGYADLVCKGAMALLRFNTWSNFVQSRLVPAQYFRDPKDYDRYLESSNFLADVNNERIEKNPLYKENLASLTNLALYMFDNDTVLIPKETSWFEEVNESEHVPLRARKIYTEDWIGLRELDRKGGLKFRSVPGDHMQIPESEIEKVAKDFFGSADRKFVTEDNYSAGEL